jgi:hypothetical protein
MFIQGYELPEARKILPTATFIGRIARHRAHQPPESLERLTIRTGQFYR